MSAEGAPAQQPEGQEMMQEKIQDQDPVPTPRAKAPAPAPPAAAEAPAAKAPAPAAAAAAAAAAPAAPAAPEKPLSCRALVLTGHGGYDKVKLQVRSQSQGLKPGELLVRIKACGLNFSELMGRQGLYDALPPPPVIMGMEGAGVVEAVAEDVRDRKVGDRVIVMARNGLWQEVAVVPVVHSAIMPEQMSFEEGAALPVNYITAYLMLFEMANLRPGKSVLVHMAAGGVGIAATQLCRTVPDVTVFGTASASKHEIIAQGGVTHPIDYRTKDYVEEIRKISPRGVDIVLDPLGGADTQKSFSLLRPMGSLIIFGAANIVTGQKRNLLALARTWFSQLSLTALKLMQTNKAVGGFHLGYLTDDDLINRTLLCLLELYKEGKIKPCIDSCYHFEEVTDAMKRMHERQNIGKVILLPEAKKEEKKAEFAAEPGEQQRKTAAAAKEEAAQEANATVM